MANYLYNGTELPALPNWDKTAYPYAMIRKRWNIDYALVVYDRPVHYIHINLNGEWDDSNANRLWCCFDRETFTWGNWGEEIGSPSAVDNSNVLWSNYDVLNYYDGEVYSTRCAASEPVPVNPPQPIDPNSLLAGYLVGCRLRALRGKA